MVVIALRFTNMSPNVEHNGSLDSPSRNLSSFGLENAWEGAVSFPKFPTSKLSNDI